MVRITVCGRREFGEVEDFGQELWIKSFIFVSFGTAACLILIS